MDSEINLQEDVGVLQEDTSNKDIPSSNTERTFENDASTGHHYLEMDNKISTKELDIVHTGLKNEEELCTEHESTYRNDTTEGRNTSETGHQIYIKQEVDILDKHLPNEGDLYYADSEISITTRRSGFEMDNKVIKKEADILDPGSPNESVCVSTDTGSKLENDAVTHGTDFELDSKIEFKELASVSDTGVHIKKESNTYNENGEIISTKIECQSDVPASNILQQNEDKDGKLEDMESAGSSGLCVQAICTETPGGEVMEPSQIGKNLHPQKSNMFQNGNNCSSASYTKHQVQNNDKGLQREIPGNSAMKLQYIIYKDINLQKCDICKKSFIMLQTLNTHTLIHKSNESFRCNDCKNKLTVVPSVRKHRGRNLYECETCKKRFSKLKNLNTHSLIHQGIKPYKCNVCNKRFAQPANLGRHSWIHKDEKPYQCEVCEKRFTRLATLNVHKLVHEGIKPHECNVCKKRFTCVGYLKRHKLTHEERKRHECNVCRKSLTSAPYLETHKLIHNDKKLYKCSICMKRFTRASNLNAHLRRHESKKPYKCNICKKRFSQLSNLNTHIFIHEGKKPHECKVCKKTFTHLSTLYDHRLIHEDRKAQECNVCKKTFTSAKYFKRHKLIHEKKKPCECKVLRKSVPNSVIFEKTQADSAVQKSQ